MLITKVELTNIKCHKDKDFAFGPGVNAIVGPNGSGKSTVLEAIGYCLFNSLSYKVNQFVTNGEKSGHIIVELVHGNNTFAYTRQVGGRDPYYEVYEYSSDEMMSSGKAASGVEAVESFTKQLLGLSEDANLQGIFEDAVGVQQGLLTAPFLLTKTKRHAVFQPLFDIDIYRKCFEKLRPVESMLTDIATKHGNDIEKCGLQLQANDKAAREWEERDEKIKGLDEEYEPIKIIHDAADKVYGDFKDQMKALKDAEKIGHEINIMISKGINVQEKLTEISKKKDELVKLTPHIRNRKKWVDLDNKMKEVSASRAAAGEQLKDVRKSIPDLEEAVEAYDLSEMDPSKEVADKLDERENALAEAGEEKATATEKHRNAENVRKKAEEGVCPILRVGCTDLECFAEKARELASNANDSREAATRNERDAKIAVKECKQALKTFTRLENDAAMKQAYERELGTARENERGLKERYGSLGEKHRETKKKRDALKYDEKKYAQAIALQHQLEDEWDENSLMAQKTVLDGNISNYTHKRDELLDRAGNITEQDLDRASLTVYGLRDQMNNLLGQKEVLMKEQPPLTNYEKWLHTIKETHEKITSLGVTQHNEELALELVKEMRRVFNSLGPEIMELLLDAINMEANDYHSALTGSPDLLFWDRDFEASIRNIDGKRIFKQLSGGQQMVTSIAIRLAILKHLGNLPIVFLDEPTANLDDERREVLAGVVGNIMGFEQVFVISHGSEFSSEVENVIELGEV